MRAAITDERVGAWLKAADPARTITFSERDAERMLHTAVATATPGSAARGRRRRWILPAAGLAVLLGVGVPGVAIASGLLAHTGWFGSPNPGSPQGTQPIGTEADGSEWIDETAADYVDVAVGLWPDYAALPAGYRADEFAASIARSTVRLNDAQTDGRSSLRQVTGIRSEFEQAARCAWRADWLDANAAGDAVRAAAAAGVLATAATWPATVATDGGGIVDGERAVADAAASDDRAAVERLNPWCSDMLDRYRG